MSHADNTHTRRDVKATTQLRLPGAPPPGPKAWMSPEWEATMAEHMPWPLRSRARAGDVKCNNAGRDHIVVNWCMVRVYSGCEVWFRREGVEATA